MTRRIALRGIVEGSARGPLLPSREAISFLGDVDIRSGRVVGDLAGVRGRSLAGVVLVMPYTRGSAGAWRFLHQLFRHGNAPAAIVSGTLPDPSVVQGAILSGIPVACDPAEDPWPLLRDGAQASLVVEEDRAVLELDA